MVGTSLKAAKLRPGKIMDRQHAARENARKITLFRLFYSDAHTPFALMSVGFCR